MTDEERKLKRKKAQPQKVSMLDLILENRKLKSELFDLKRRVEELERNPSTMRIGFLPKVGGA